MNSEKHPLFVSCPSGVEPLLREELLELGIESLQIGYRGVFIKEWDWDTIYLVNYCSRLALRVLLPMARFRCFDKKNLYKHAMEVDWSYFFKKGTTFAIDANVSHKELRNSLFAAQVLKDAICDQLREKTGVRPSVNVERPDLQLNLFIHQQMAIISFDTSGVSLHKRGYRQESVEAPIQETLAAAILRLSQYRGEEIFLDPCCGSGTFLIEAALLASNTAPGYLRTLWGFMHHPEFNVGKWLLFKQAVDAKRRMLPQGHLFGIDRSEKAVGAARINLKVAGFQGQVTIQKADFREYVPTMQPNFILANPPYGKRLEELETLRPLYRSLGDFIKKYGAKKGKGFVFTSSLELAKEVGLAASRRYIFNNGGLDSRLLEFDIF